MRHLKLFEGFNTGEKIEKANELIFQWISLKIVWSNELEVRYAAPRKLNPYTFGPSPSLYEFFDTNGMILFSMNIDKDSDWYGSVYYISWSGYHLFRKIFNIGTSNGSPLTDQSKVDQCLKKALSQTLIKYLKHKNIEIST